MTVLKRAIPLMQFTTGQRVRILRRMRQVALERGLRDLLPVIDEALRHELAAQELDNQWTGYKRARYGGQIKDIDAIVDQLLAGLRDMAQARMRGLPVHDPIVAMCEHFLAQVFPNGLVAIVSMSYVDQVSAVEAIIQRLTGDLADTVRQLGMEDQRDRLIELNAEYRRLIDEGRQDVRYVEVQAARERGQQQLREVVAAVLGSFRDSTDVHHVATREALLAPLMIQFDETRAIAKARRRNGAGPEDDLGELEGAVPEDDDLLGDEPVESPVAEAGDLDLPQTA